MDLLTIVWQLHCSWDSVFAIFPMAFLISGANFLPSWDDAADPRAKSTSTRLRFTQAASLSLGVEALVATERHVPNQIWFLVTCVGQRFSKSSSPSFLLHGQTRYKVSTSLVATQSSRFEPFFPNCHGAFDDLTTFPRLFIEEAQTQVHLFEQRGC